MQPRNKKGQYARNWWITIAILLGAFIMFYAMWDTYFSQTEDYKATSFAPTTVYASEVETKEHAIDRLKNLLTQEMAACEYPGYDQATAIPQWDDNSKGNLPTKDKLSYGQYQFKISTMQRFYKQLYGKELSNYDAIQTAMDATKARTVAIDAWIKLPGSINEWSCATETMKAQVTDIRFLSQD